jgi:hypothetical protein
MRSIYSRACLCLPGEVAARLYYNIIYGMDELSLIRVRVVDPSSVSSSRTSFLFWRNNLFWADDVVWTTVLILTSGESQRSETNNCEKEPEWMRFDQNEVGRQRGENVTEPQTPQEESKSKLSSTLCTLNEKDDETFVIQKAGHCSISWRLLEKR